jgi:hypothetical protein
MMRNKNVVYNPDTGKWDAYIDGRYIGGFPTKDAALDRLDSIEIDEGGDDYIPSNDAEDRYNRGGW